MMILSVERGSVCMGDDATDNGFKMEVDPSETFSTILKRVIQKGYPGANVHAVVVWTAMVRQKSVFGKSVSLLHIKRRPGHKDEMFEVSAEWLHSTLAHYMEVFQENEPTLYFHYISQGESIKVDELKPFI